MKKSRKNDVIKSANCIIRKSGYSKLGFSQIASTLGVSRENVHHYFKKKELLGNACMNQMMQDLNYKFDEILNEDTSCNIKLLNYFKIYKTQQNEQEDCPIVALLADYEDLPLSMKEQIKNLVQIEQTNMEKLLKKGKEENIFFFEEDIKTKALMTIILLKGAVSYAKIYDNFSDISSTVIKELQKKIKS